MTRCHCVQRTKSSVESPDIDARRIPRSAARGCRPRRSRRTRPSFDAPRNTAPASRTAASAAEGSSTSSSRCSGANVLANASASSSVAAHSTPPRGERGGDDLAPIARRDRRAKQRPPRAAPPLRPRRRRASASGSCSACAISSRARRRARGRAVGHDEQFARAGGRVDPDDAVHRRFAPATHALLRAHDGPRAARSPCRTPSRRSRPRRRARTRASRQRVRPPGTRSRSGVRSRRSGDEHNRTFATPRARTPRASLLGYAARRPALLPRRRASGSAAADAHAGSTSTSTTGGRDARCARAMFATAMLERRAQLRRERGERGVTRRAAPRARQASRRRTPQRTRAGRRRPRRRARVRRVTCAATSGGTPTSRRARPAPFAFARERGVASYRIRGALTARAFRCASRGCLRRRPRAARRSCGRCPARAPPRARRRSCRRSSLR